MADCNLRQREQSRGICRLSVSLFLSPPYPYSFPPQYKSSLSCLSLSLDSCLSPHPLPQFQNSNHTVTHCFTPPPSPSLPKLPTHPCVKMSAAAAEKKLIFSIDVGTTETRKIFIILPSVTLRPS